MSIPVSAVMNSVGSGETPKYHLVAKNPRHADENEIRRRLNARTGFDDSKSRYWLDNFRGVLFEALAANETVDCGFLYAKLYATGTIPSLTAQPTRDANPVRGRIYFKGEFADQLAAIDLINETLTVNPLIYEVQQDGVKGMNRIESTTARVVMNVNRGKIDPAQADNGVWIEDLKTNAKLVDGSVTYSDSSTCYVVFPTLPVSGKYRLVLATRDGKDPAEYVLARVTRNVVVANEEVRHG